MMPHQHLAVLQGGRFKRDELEIAKRRFSRGPVVEKNLRVDRQDRAPISGQSVSS